MTAKLEDLTPKEFACALSMACPRVLAVAQCPMGDCPTVMEYGGELVIIGKASGVEQFPELAGRIGEDEQAVIVPRDLVEAALKAYHQG